MLHLVTIQGMIGCSSYVALNKKVGNNGEDESEAKEGERAVSLPTPMAGSTWTQSNDWISTEEHCAFVPIPMYQYPQLVFPPLVFPLSHPVNKVHSQYIHILSDEESK
jgi:hypothetical protein